MSNTEQLAPRISGGNGYAWYFDDTIGELVPCYGRGTPLDKYRNFGQQPNQRFLINRTLPVGTLFWTTGAGTAVTAASETSLLANAGFAGPSYPGATAGTIPAGTLNQVGKVLWFRAQGTITDTASPATVSDLITFKLGSVIVCGTAAAGTALATMVGSPFPWFFDGMLTVLTTGATGTILGQGRFTYWTTNNKTRVSWAAYQSAASTVDLTAAQAVSLMNTWSATDDSETITCQKLTVGLYS